MLSPVTGHCGKGPGNEDGPLPVSVLSGFVIGQSAVINYANRMAVCERSLWQFVMFLHNYWDKMCGLLVVQEPAIKDEL